MKNKISSEYQQFKADLRKISPILLVISVLTVVLMNLFANKSIDTGMEYLRLDGGIIVSGVAFLIGDIIVKTYGAKTSVRMTIVSVIINLFVCIFFFIVAKIPGKWGEFYSNGELEIINVALDNTLANNIFIMMGSMLAYIVASVVNAILNELIGKHVKDNFFGFAYRSYISTMLAQFVDNMVFSLLVSTTLFGWTLVECLFCSLFGAFVELLCEILLSPLGYYFSKRINQEVKNESIGDR